MSSEQPKNSTTGGFCPCLQDFLSLSKLKEYLFSVLAVNLMFKLCKPAAREAEVKANKIVTFSVTCLSANFFIIWEMFL